MMFVKFWGVRGVDSNSRPFESHFSGGNTSCVEIRTDEAVFILMLEPASAGLAQIS